MHLTIALLALTNLKIIAFSVCSNYTTPPLQYAINAASASTQLSDAQRLCERHLIEKNELSLQLSGVVSELSSLRGTAVKRELEFAADSAAAKAAIQQLESEFASLKSEVASVSSQRDEALASAAGAVSQLDALKSELESSLSALRASHESTLRDLHCDSSILAAAKADSDARLLAADDCIIELQKNVALLTEDSAKLASEAAVLRSNFSSSEAERHAAALQIDNLHAQHAVAMAAMTDRMTECENEIRTYCDKIAVLNSEIAASKVLSSDAHATLTTSLDRSRQLEEHVATMANDIAIERRTCAQAVEELQVLRTQALQHETVAAALIDERDQANSNVAAMRLLLDEKISANVALSATLDSLKAELTASLHSMSDERATTAADQKALAQVMLGLRENLEAAEAGASTMRTTIRDLEVNLESARDSRDALAIEVGAAREHTTSLQKELSAARISNQELVDDRDATSRLLHEKEAALAQVSMEVDQLSADLKDTRAKLHVVSSASEVLLQDLNAERSRSLQLEKDLTDGALAIQQFTVDRETTVSREREARLIHESETASLTERLSSEAKVSAELRDRNRSIESTLATLAEKLRTEEHERLSALEKLAGLENNYAALQSKLSTEESTSAVLRGSISNLEAESSSMRERLEAESFELREKLKSCESTRTEAEVKLDDQLKALESLRSRLVAEETAFKSLQEKLACADITIVSLRENVVTLEATSAICEEKLRNSERSRAALSDELAAAKELSADLRAKCDLEATSIGALQDKLRALEDLSAKASTTANVKLTAAEASNHELMIERAQLQLDLDEAIDEKKEAASAALALREELASVQTQIADQTAIQARLTEAVASGGLLERKLSLVVAKVKTLLADEASNAEARQSAEADARELRVNAQIAQTRADAVAAELIKVKADLIAALADAKIQADEAALLRKSLATEQVGTLICRRCIVQFTLLLHSCRPLDWQLSRVCKKLKRRLQR